MRSGHFSILLIGLALWAIAGGGLTRAQTYDFVRKISPFPIFDESGWPYEHPLTGGMNRPVHQFVDIDGDADPDLFIQDRANLLTFFRNVGSPTNYQFLWETDQFQDLAVGQWFKFADADNDGDFDLFAEKPFGIIMYYRNDGSPTAPNFVLAKDSLRDVAGDLILVDGFSIPEWVDIDCDNDQDLFLGRLTGRITFYEFVGLDADQVPRYQFVTDAFEDLLIITGGGAQEGIPGASPLAGRHGANSLTFVDIDADQDQDLFWGDFFASSVIFLENYGTCTTPDFVQDSIVENYPPNDPLNTGGYNVPRFADIDGDSDMDLFVGVLGGSGSFITDRAENFYYYENVGAPTAPLFILRTRQFIFSIDLGQNTIPALVDIDADGDLDLFLANQEDLHAPDHANSRLYFYENQGSAAGPSFRLVNSHYLGDDVRFELNYCPAFADLDGNGVLDLYLGMWNGKIVYYQNQGSATTPNFVRITDNWAGIDVGNNSTPAFVDIDADGDLDLFIGEFGGNLNFYRNEGDPTNPNFVLVDQNYLGIDVGEFSVPGFADLDGDGDADMILGSDSQGMFLYRNDGTPQSPNFVLDNTFQIPLHLRSAPRFADIDADGDLDLFSGVDGGGLVFYENQEVVGISPSGEELPGVPGRIVLLGNYPNPFNPVTNIGFRISDFGFVEVAVYDLLGQKVKTLVNGHLTAGDHTVQWDG
ncbi:MAG: hypothetical protein D6681_14335, partial [Calditrichaeota bacterium]